MLRFYKILIASVLVVVPVQLTAQVHPEIVPIVLDLVLSDESATQVQNQAPVADAGSDVKILESTVHILNASNSTDDNGIVSYQWKQDGDVVSDQESFSKTYGRGSHFFTLKVTDADGLSDVTQVAVHAVSQTMITDENSTKNTTRLADRQTLLTNLSIEMNRLRSEAPQKYIDQQTNNDREVALELIVPLSAPPVATQYVAVSKSADIVIAEQDYFTLDDISLQTRNSKLYLINRTNRQFGELLARYTDSDGKLVMVRFLMDSVVEAFSEYEIAHFEQSSEMQIVRVYPLFDAQISFRRNSQYSDPKQWRDTTAAEEETYKTHLGHSKYMNNSVHAFKMFGALQDTQSYLGLDFSWIWYPLYYSEMTAYGNASEYIFNELFFYLTPKDIPFDMQTFIAAGAVGKASPGVYRGIRMVSVIEFQLSHTDGLSYQMMLNSHVTYTHEMMHAYKYTHESGMTHGYSDVLGVVMYNFYGKEKIVEKLPKYVFSTRKLADHKHEVTVFSTQDSNESYFNVDLYSNSKISATITATSQDNVFIIETDSGYSPEYILRVSSFDSSQVMSKIISD